MSARIKARDLQYALRRIRPYRAGARESYDKLRGVGIRADEKRVTVWAMDGYRLAECWAENRGDPIPPTAIPRMYVNTLETLLRTEDHDALIDFGPEGSEFYDQQWRHEPFSFANGELFLDEIKAEITVDRARLLKLVTNLKPKADELARNDKHDGGTLRLALREGRMFLLPGREGNEPVLLQVGDGYGDADTGINPLWLKQALDVPRSSVTIRVAQANQPIALIFNGAPVRVAIMPINNIERINV